MKKHISRLPEEGERSGRDSSDRSCLFRFSKHLRLFLGAFPVKLKQDVRL